MDLASKDLKKRIVRIVTWLIVGTLIVSISVLIFLFNSGTSLFSISGTSMEPTLQDRDSVILQQAKEIENGQIIFFDKPANWNYESQDSTVLVKRVAAIPGDTITYDGESFLVNGEVAYSLAEDNYECDAGPVGYEHTVTNKQVFVMGDNARASLDSRRIFCDGEPEKSYITKRAIINYGHIVTKF